MLPIIDGCVSFYGEPERRHALTRLADWLNDLAVQLFDLAGRIRGCAMSGERIDVLAVMDDVERGMRSVSTILADEMREARAAVAELIAQRDRYENALHLIASGDQRPGHVAAVTKSRMAEIARAALARVQGGA